MRKISEQELKNMLDKHDKWLNNKEGGEQANLSSADLRFADLSYADLSYADLRYANLRYANLSYANLSSANLSYADLSYANLRSANLSSANLILFQFQRDWAYFTFDGALRIGCLFMPISEWLAGFEEIGRKHHYTALQIEMYGSFIKTCAEKFKDGKFEVNK